MKRRGPNRKQRSKAAGRAERRALLAGLLVVLTLAPIGILAWQTFETTGSHRTSAEGVLSDYARLGAAEFHRRAASKFEALCIFPAGHELGKTVGRDMRLELPRRKALSPEKTADYDFAFRVVRAFFISDLDEKTVRVGDEGYSDAERKWIYDVITRDRASQAKPPERPSLVYARYEGKPRIVVHFNLRGHEGKSLGFCGFDTSWTGIRELLRHCYDGEPVLPGLLAERLDDPTDLAITIHDGKRELFRSGRPFSGESISGSVPLGSWSDDLRVEGRIRADAAQDLIIGGLPRSRMPVIIALLVSSLVLVGATGLFLKRELELARTRTEFVANASHELRTPLAQIRLFAETLLLGRVRSRDEARRALEVIDREARRLTHRVDNVLQFSRSERGIVDLAPETRRLSPLIQEAVDLFEPLARAREVVLATDIADDPEVRIDSDAFQRVLINLLDNAVKYGPDGQTVTVTLAAQNGHAKLIVDDEGPGVARADAGKIWKRYYRGRSAQKDAVDGSGIGLSVVRELVELHGGEVRVKSRPKGGSRFMVDLPTAGSSRRSRPRKNTNGAHPAH